MDLVSFGGREGGSYRRLDKEDKQHRGRLLSDLSLFLAVVFIEQQHYVIIRGFFLN